MQTSKYLRYPLFVIGVFLCSDCFSQGKILEMKDSTGFISVRTQRGDTLLIGYDEAYVLNKGTFKLYQESHSKIKNVNASIKALMENYESTISLQDSMLRDKERFYQLLKTNFDSVANKTNNFLSKTDGNINLINQSLSNAGDNVNSIKTHIDSSLEKLKLQQRQKIKLMVGGFTVGVGITALIFVVAK